MSRLLNIKNVVKKYVKESDLFKEYVLFALSTVVFNAARLLAEMMVAKIIGPNYYGMWTFFLLVVGYAWCLHLGVVTALSREIPFNMGKGEFGVIKEIKQVGFKVILLTTFLCSVFFGVLTWLFNRAVFPLSLPILIVFFVTHQLYQYIQYVLRAELKYNKASFQHGVTGILIFAIAVPLLLKWQLDGLVIGYTIAFVIGVLGTNSQKNVLLIGKLAIRKSVLLHLFKIGFPLMAIGFFYMVIVGVDRWMVLSLLGTKNLGYYSFSYNIFSVGMLFINLFATQSYHRLSFHYGKTESMLQMVRLLKKQIWIALILTSLISIGVLCILPIVIYLVPKYEPSLRVAQILLIGSPFLGVALIISGFFNVVSKQRRLLIPMAFAVTVNVVLGLILVRAGYGKEGVAIGTVCSYALYSLLLYRQVKVLH